LGDYNTLNVSVITKQILKNVLFISRDIHLCVQIVNYAGKHPLSHVSVDCVVLGFDGFHFKCTLLKRTGVEGEQPFNDLKLPGGLIFANEDLDAAAHRIVGEHINTNALFLRQIPELWIAI
jgi:hypothetical protein